MFRADICAACGTEDLKLIPANELAKGGSNMSVDQGIGLVGIIATIILGLFAVKKVINRSRSQRQSVGKGSIGIQSGRDTKIDG